MSLILIKSKNEYSIYKKMDRYYITKSSTIIYSSDNLDEIDLLFNYLVSK
jgi:hypothetical protein